LLQCSENIPFFALSRNISNIKYEGNLLIRKKAKTYRERNYNKSNLLYEENFSDDAMLLFQAMISLRISNVLAISENIRNSYSPDIL
jgi:hypothetical protein